MNPSKEEDAQPNDREEREERRRYPDSCKASRGSPTSIQPKVPLHMHVTSTYLPFTPVSSLYKTKCRHESISGAVEEVPLQSGLKDV
jgi:hypothetical protein